MTPAPPISESQKPDAEYVATLRQKLEAAREAAKARHLTMPGREAAMAYSLEIERMLQGHLDVMAQRLGRDPKEHGLSLIAVGGFGRLELAYYSDVDFCFITEREPSEDEQAFIKAVLYPLWDLRLDLGYGVHSVRECLAMLGSDLSKATAFLVTRHLWGDSALSEELVDRMHGKLHKHHTLWFVTSLQEEMKSRHARAGDTVFLLEPDLKQSRGGLRDIHQLLWIAFASYGSSNVDALVSNGLITAEERDQLNTAWSFLIDVRNTLHFMSNRRVDKLALDKQNAVSRMLGYEATDAALPEELLMRAFYDHALVVERLSQRLLRTTLSRTPGTRESISDMELPRQHDRHFWQQGDKLWMDPRDFEEVEHDKLWPFRLFLCAAREGLEVYHETLRLVERSLKQIDDKIRSSAAPRDFLLAILGAQGKVATTIRAMHRCGLLTAYLPEFALVRNLPRIDHYHQYTVDEHMIRTIGVCEELMKSPPPKGMEHAGEVANEVLRVDLLNFALLFHDIGKGEGRAHVIRGMHIIQRIAERIGMRAKEQEVVRLLVANHQKMTHMALRRDIEDPSLPKELAEAVGDPELLRMLYVHTVCDLRAVSHESWNDWRGRLLALLYERTLDELRGIKRERQQRAPTNFIREQIIKELEQDVVEGQAYDPKELDRFLTDMPERYLRSAAATDIAKNFLVSRLLNDNHPIHFQISTFEGQSYVEITFMARDAPGLFSNICGALAAKRINILSAQVYTSKSGIAVDILQVDVPALLRPELDNVIGKIRDRLQKILRTGEKPDWAKSGDKNMLPVSADRLSKRPPRVEIKNDMSPTHTVIEVSAPDRPGLLSEITGIFDRFSINIDLAFIATESYQIVDTFYVTDLETNKLKEGGKLASLKEELMTAIHAGIKGVA